VRREELEQLLADRASHYVSTTVGSFEAIVAQSSEPGIDISIGAEAGAGPAPEASKGNSEAPERSAPPRDGRADQVPQSGASPNEPAEEAPAVVRELTLPKFKYATEVRVAAPSILNTALSEDQLWTFDEQGVVYDKFAAQLEEAVGDISTLQLSGSDDAARQWILDNRAVLDAVSILQSE
jgi:hypothetical protein